MEKSVARRTTNTSRSSGRGKIYTVRTTAVEGRREPALTVAFSPRESHDIEADIEFVDVVDRLERLFDSWHHSDNFKASKSRGFLLALLVNDDVLRSTYKIALEAMSPQKFEGNLRELLRSFANDLHEEAHEAHEYRISLCFDLDRRFIAHFIRLLFTKESSVCEDDTHQSQRQLLDTLIVSAHWFSQPHVKNPSIVYQMASFVTNSKAFVTLRTGVKRFAEPTTSFNSSSPKRQASAAVPTEERSPIPGKATDVPSDKVEKSNIRQLFVGSTVSKLLDPPLVFSRSLLFRSSRYIVGQALGFLQGFNLYEPPLSADCVRLKWICVSPSCPQMANLN